MTVMMDEMTATGNESQSTTVPSKMMKTADQETTSRSRAKLGQYFETMTVTTKTNHKEVKIQQSQIFRVFSLCLLRSITEDHDEHNYYDEDNDPSAGSDEQRWGGHNVGDG